MPADFIRVSKKFATQSKRTMAEKGMLDNTSVSVAAVGVAGPVKYSTSKIARGQLGSGLHQVWMTDIIKHCGSKVLFVCDFAHGVGEVMKAAIDCKVTEEATTNNVRVCAWGQDPRKVFFSEIGTAVGRTEMSKLYVSGKLVVAGHQPISDPGPRPERTRKLVKALLQKPLKSLSLNSEGYLIIPTKEEIANACPVALSDEQEEDFAGWRIEFPIPAAAAAAAAAVGATEGGSGGGGADGSSSGPSSGGAGAAGGGKGAESVTPVTPGTQAASIEVLKEKLGTRFYFKNLCPKVVLLLSVR